MTLDHMIAGNEAPQRPEDSETQLARIRHRLARLYQIMQENRRRVDEERQEFTDPCIGYFLSGKNAGRQSENGDGYPAGKAYDRGGTHRLYPGNPQPDG